jgi:hypothetical protein
MSMTEQEWQASPDLELMFRYLRRKAVATDRKLRLFAAGCCRMIWDLIPDGLPRASVALAERLADSSVEEQEVEAVRQPLWEVWRGQRDRKTAGAIALDAAYWCSDAQVTEAAHRAAFLSWSAAIEAAERYTDTLLRQEEEKRRVLLRDIIPTPLNRRQTRLAAAYRTPQVVSLAQAVYEERLLPSGRLDLARLAVLADALEDAGCADRAILDHLRGSGPHVRACWAVDLCCGIE